MHCNRPARCRAFWWHCQAWSETGGVAGKLMLASGGSGASLLLSQIPQWQNAASVHLIYVCSYVFYDVLDVSCGFLCRYYAVATLPLLLKMCRSMWDNNNSASCQQTSDRSRRILLHLCSSFMLDWALCPCNSSGGGGNRRMGPSNVYLSCNIAAAV